MRSMTHARRIFHVNHHHSWEIRRITSHLRRIYPESPTCRIFTALMPKKCDIINTHIIRTFTNQNGPNRAHFPRMHIYAEFTPDFLLCELHETHRTFIAYFYTGTSHGHITYVCTFLCECHNARYNEKLNRFHRIKGWAFRIC